MHRLFAYFSLTLLLCTSCDRARKKGNDGSGSNGRVAVGKLVITPPTFETAKGSAYAAGEGFMDQQLAVLGSDDIRLKAEKALAGQHREINPAGVVIQTARVKGSNVVNVIGRGASWESSAALVDAVMDAYIASVRPDTAGQAATAQDSNHVEKDLAEAERGWTSFRLENDPSKLASDLAQTERRAKRLAVAREYYEQELDMSGKLNLEQDLIRRQSSPSVPSEMPVELAMLVRTTLSVGELAFLSAIKGANAGATEAARKEAEKDRQERMASLQKQMEISKDLAATATKEIERIKSLQKQADELQTRLQEAKNAYSESKKREKYSGIGLNDPIHPVVSITERASKQ